ncbi:MAG: hypothetical protein JSS86_23785, partial [Cyanobacteria bacterium SZAS LIN-2]|nr:hypothetical protein [Cyanobacteria bacterium SZAS LIN-2]
QGKKQALFFLGLGALVAAIPAVPMMWMLANTCTAPERFVSVSYQGPFGLAISFCATILPGLVLVVLGVMDWRSKTFFRTTRAIAGYAIVGIFAIYFTFVAKLFGGPILESIIHQRPFDSTVWKESLKSKSSDQVRLNMVDDLLSKNKLVGMSRADVEKLIGKPPPTEYFSEYQYVYWLGPERGFISIDSEWLALKFKDDVVIEATVVRD